MIEQISVKFFTRFLHLNGFRWGLFGLWLFSAIVRFWHLGQFNKLVFDEVYYAKFSNNYLIGKEFFHSHPPLAQYIIATGMAIASFFPTSPEQMNELTGSLRSTFSYRWFNALTGSFFPLLVGAIAYQLSNRKSYCLLATFLASLDGLFLVESRYALNNIYLLSFGLLGQLFFLLFLKDPRKKVFNLILSGLFFGMTISVKWNGLGFLLGIVLFTLLIWFKENYLNNYDKNTLFPRLLFYRNINSITLKNINIVGLLMILFSMTLMTYSLLWIPHLIMNPQYNFIEVHQQILSFHERVGGNNQETHPYCSPWYSWLLMVRPVAYYYQKITVGNETLIHDVHAMGNPILWWCSTLAILLLTALICQRLFLGEFRSLLSGYPNLILLYFILNYLANLLPWISVSRCTFLYHYMGAYVFSWLGLAWILEHWLNSSLKDYRWLAKGLLLLIVLAFFYWLPLYLGIPLTENQFKIRLLFKSWI